MKAFAEELSGIIASFSCIQSPESSIFAYGVHQLLESGLFCMHFDSNEVEQLLQFDILGKICCMFYVVIMYFVDSQQGWPPIRHHSLSRGHQETEPPT